MYRYTHTHIHTHTHTHTHTYTHTHAHTHTNTHTRNICLVSIQCVCIHIHTDNMHTEHIRISKFNKGANGNKVLPLTMSLRLASHLHSSKRTAIVSMLPSRTAYCTAVIPF